MSNLGMYQTMTTLAKRLGGPGNLGITTLATGAVGGKLVEVVIKKTYRFIKKKCACRGVEGVGRSNRAYAVCRAAETTAGLKFKEGDLFKVLERDGDAVLIELVGGADNPYVVSSDVLEMISDFR